MGLSKIEIVIFPGFGIQFFFVFNFSTLEHVLLGRLAKNYCKMAFESV